MQFAAAHDVTAAVNHRINGADEFILGGALAFHVLEVIDHEEAHPA